MAESFLGLYLSQKNGKFKHSLNLQKAFSNGRLENNDKANGVRDQGVVDDGGLSDWKEAKREVDLKENQLILELDPGYGIS